MAIKRLASQFSATDVGLERGNIRTNSERAIYVSELALV